MNIGFTGTRNGMTPEQKEMLKCTFQEYALAAEYAKDKMGFIHGGAEGADYEAHWIAYRGSHPGGNFHAQYFYNIYIHPAIGAFLKRSNFINKNLDPVLIVHKPRPPLERNRVIVDHCDLLIATPKGIEEELRSGTWATIRYARRRGRKLIIIWPDGAIHITEAKDGF